MVFWCYFLQKLYKNLFSTHHQLEIVGGKPELSEKAVEEMEETLGVSGHEVAAFIAAAKKCKTESASITDE